MLFRSRLPNDRGQTPLAGAAFKGDSAIAELLIQHGADINGRSFDGKTPLMFAAMFDRAAMIDLLLQHGADPTISTENGMTAVSLAQAMGAQQSLARLITLGFNP